MELFYPPRLSLHTTGHLHNLKTVVFCQSTSVASQAEGIRLPTPNAYLANRGG